MSKKYLNRYLIASTRLQKWDYGCNGAYFVTICTNDRQKFFGEIKHGLMVLNDIGKIALQFWIEIPMHFPYVFLGDFIVMPNHVHGIIMINKSFKSIRGDDPGQSVKRKQTDMASRKWKSGILGVIVNQYKRICTLHARKIAPDFKWQPRFYDRIIRNEIICHKVSRYIRLNPFYAGS